VTGQALEQLTDEIDVGVAVLADTFLTRLVCPTKIFAYLATATPFVASRLGGVEAIVRHGQHGWLVENTPAAWEQAIRDSYANFSRYQHIALQCHALATTLQWEDRARRIVEFLACPAPLSAADRGKAGRPTGTVS
jgi:glycosyltransferase involved in cell wall biosynthesis